MRDERLESDWIAQDWEDVEKYDALALDRILFRVFTMGKG
jgi:hypothetical protein